MADILATGSSALLAYQAALNTTSHNIANANTAGYSRQRVDLVSKLGDGSGSGYIGNGVDVDSVQRITDALLNARLQCSNSDSARIHSSSTYAEQIDALLSASGTSRTAPLQSLFYLHIALSNA